MAFAVETSPVDKYTSELYNSLGSFWTRVYTDKDFIAGLSKANSLLLAQCYLNTLELFACLNRTDIPIFHREKWYPIVIRESQANTGDTVKLYIGITPEATIGPQPKDSVYGENTEFYIGGEAIPKDFISFPFQTNSVFSGLPCICSTILNPAKIYINGVDFIIKQGVIIFRKELNPFNPINKFPIRTVATPDGSTDKEVVLWGADALIDRNYVPDHFGYLQKNTYEDPIYGKEVTNSILELRSSGASKWLLLKSLGKLFATPVVKNESETIIDIAPSSDGYTCVITDKEVYRCRPEETLLSSVKKGAVFTRGNFLTNTVRLYFKLNPDKFYQASGYTIGQLVSDVPRLPLFKGFIHPDGLLSGILAPWEEVDITYEGTDRNGNPKLKFTLLGSFGTVDGYWETVWLRAESEKINIAKVLEDYIFTDASFTPGAVVGKINPMLFFIKNCLRSNLSILIVDFNALPEYIKSLNILYELNKVMAAHSLMLMIGHRTIIENQYDIGAQRSVLDAYLGISGLFIPKYVGRRVTENSGSDGLLNYFDTKPKFRQVKI